jgi:hypothetical protein
MHSWDGVVDMPRDLLPALHRDHPIAQIHVSLRQLDQAIVSTEQLRRLSVSLPCSDVTNPDSLAQFERLRHILLRSSNLRTLALDLHLDVNLLKAASQETYKLVPDTINRIQIPLKQSDRMPRLEELAINSRTYDFDHEHCKRLLHCMDWTRLTRLRLGPPNPIHFFQVFTDCLPVLEHLEISYQAAESFYPSPPADYYKACSRFISSLRLLKTINIHCDRVDLDQPFWHRLAATHGERLESFSLQSNRELYEEPTWRSTIPEFLGNFTALRTLELTILYTRPQEYVSCTHCLKPWHALVSNPDYDSSSILTK